MARTNEGSVASVTAQRLSDDDADDDAMFELGDICTPPLGRNAEPVLALGSDIFAVDGSPLASTPRAQTLGEVDEALIRYLLDLKA